MKVRETDPRGQCPFTRGKLFAILCFSNFLAWNSDGGGVGVGVVGMGVGLELPRVSGNAKETSERLP